MRIGIDVSSAARSPRTGIGRYIAELVAALARLESGCRFDLLYRLSRWKRRRYFLRPPDPSFRTRCLLERLHGGYPRRLAVFHGPDARLPGYRNLPLVATVHDLFSADSAGFAGAGFRAKKVSRYADVARRAAAVIAVSEHTRRRFLLHTGADPDKVRVIPHGVERRFAAATAAQCEQALRRHGIERPYALYVGQLSRRKNLVTALEAVARLPAELTLVLAGPPADGADAIADAHRRLGLGRRVRVLGAVADADLPPLYAGAAVHLLLSLDEGFGMPVLEAFVAGVPVVASDRGAIPEVAADAALLVDPTDVPAVTHAVERVVSEPGLADELRRRGRARAAEYTWERAARQTLALYREVAGVA
ncbi:MAG: glycosyltransferase family 4 protein [Planctomycetes bacterium]|nr:glycosyltransferase family 4 protein [Planctomycetota bacterium]